MLDVAQAYRHCQAVTSSQARNFSYGIRLLPPAKRDALSAVYAFARRVDDIGDGDAADDEKLAGLAQARAELHGLDRHGDDPVAVALADAARRLPIPLTAFDELIDGVEMDVRGAQYQTIDELVHYCRCVAGSIGRLSLGVFGTADPSAAAPIADALGVALQLTNILRDVREDLAGGRVYLPKEDLAQHGVTLHLGADGAVEGPREALCELIRFEAGRAEAWYADGLRLLPMLDRRSAACTGAMAGIYHRLLHRMAAAPQTVLVRRNSLPTWEKALVAVRSLAGLRP